MQAMKIPCPHGEVRVVVTRRSVSYRHWDGSRCDVLDSMYRSPVRLPPMNDLEKVVAQRRDWAHALQELQYRVIEIRSWKGRMPVVRTGEGG